MELSLYGDSSYKICLLNQSDVHKKLVRNNGILTKFIYFCECNFDIYIYIHNFQCRTICDTYHIVYKKFHRKGVS